MSKPRIRLAQNERPVAVAVIRGVIVILQALAARFDEGNLKGAITLLEASIETLSPSPVEQEK